MKLKTLITALSLALSPNLWAKTEAHVVANELEISGLDDGQKYQLKLQLPNKQVKQLVLQPAAAISFTAMDFAMHDFVDGQYKYELIPISSTLKTRDQQTSQTKTKIGSSFSGAFTVLNGKSTNDQDETEINDDPVIQAAPISGDQTIRNSLCVGTDCIDTETYGFDTIKLKENNLRIKFDDSSTAGTFPVNDWELTANDSTAGGLNFFGVTDITANNRPFTIEAGAGANALYVDDNGRIGIGTSTPVTDVHILNGNTPTLRLDQGPSSGFTPQTWDVAGNETNFFIRDATNGSTLPLRIRPGAPSDAVSITADGNVGMGLSNPQNSLHIRENNGNAGIILENTSTTESWKFVNKSNSFQVSKVGAPGTQFKIFDDGSAVIGDSGTITNFDMDTSGNVTIQGALSQNSDVTTKENIQLVNTGEVLKKVMDLPISVWNYRFDDDSIKHLGPMAQDFFAQFNLGQSETKITSIDTSGVALASIKELGKQLAKKDQEVMSLKLKNEELQSRLAAIEDKLSKL